MSAVQGVRVQDGVEDWACTMCGWHEWSDVEKAPVREWPRQGAFTDRKVRA